MGMISEFKEFAMKGNLVDLAVGFILGGAFSTIVSSLVDDIFMPVIGQLTGGVDLSNLYYNMDGTDYATVEIAKESGDTIIHYGAFLQASVTFLIVALVLFFIIKAMNKAKKKEEAAPSSPPANEVLLAEIRDLLARQNAKL